MFLGSLATPNITGALHSVSPNIVGRSTSEIASASLARMKLLMETLCVVADSDMLITPVFRLIFVSNYVTKHSHLLFAFGKSGMSRRLPDTNQRKLPRQERSKATVEAILIAATQVLIEDGYERETTASMADGAGVDRKRP